MLILFKRRCPTEHVLESNIRLMIEGRQTCSLTFVAVRRRCVLYYLTGTLKPQSNGPLYGSTVVGTLAVDGWDVTFGTARRTWAGCGNSPPFKGQCTN